MGKLYFLPVYCILNPIALSYILTTTTITITTAGCVRWRVWWTVPCLYGAARWSAGCTRTLGTATRRPELWYSGCWTPCAHPCTLYSAGASLLLLLLIPMAILLLCLYCFLIYFKVWAIAFIYFTLIVICSITTMFIYLICTLTNYYLPIHTYTYYTYYYCTIGGFYTASCRTLTESFLFCRILKLKTCAACGGTPICYSTICCLPTSHTHWHIRSF